MHVVRFKKQQKLRQGQAYVRHHATHIRSLTCMYAVDFMGWIRSVPGIQLLWQQVRGPAL